MKGFLIATAMLLLVGALFGSRWEHWVMVALAPGVPFDDRSAPVAPDYTDAAAWTAHPEQRFRPLREVRIIPGRQTTRRAELPTAASIPG